jgi:uncharacterized protein YbaA (DUF1428 family)
MAEYVDGFLVAVPKKNLAKYKKVARLFGKVCREHGAIEVRECVGDDVTKGKLTSFPRALLLKRGEVVVFSYIVYKSRKARDSANKKIMSDPRVAGAMNGEDMPFDGARMIWGGFQTLLRA